MNPQRRATGAATANNRHIADRERQRTRRQRETFGAPGVGEGTKLARRFQKFLVAQEPRRKADAAGGDSHAKLHKPGEDVLFDLACHPGLLGSRVGRRMGIGISGEGTIGLRCFFQPHALVDVSELLDQPPPDGIARFLRGNTLPRHGIGQLRHHMPIHAAQALISEKASRSSGESTMLKRLLPEPAEFGTFFLTERLCNVPVVPEINGSIQVFDIPQPAGKMKVACDISLQQILTRITRKPHHGRKSLRSPRRNPILLVEPRQIAIGIEQITPLIRSVEAARPQRRQQLTCLRRREQARFEDRHLPLKHFLEVLDGDDTLTKLQHVEGVIEPIGTPAAAERVGDALDRIAQALGNLPAREAQAPAGESLIDRPPMGLSNPLQLLDNAIPPALERCAIPLTSTVGQHSANPGDKSRSFLRKREVLRGESADQPLEKQQIPPQV